MMHEAGREYQSLKVEGEVLFLLTRSTKTKFYLSTIPTQNYFSTHINEREKKLNDVINLFFF